MDALELVLVSREQLGEAQATADYSIRITLGPSRVLAAAPHAQKSCT